MSPTVYETFMRLAIEYYRVALHGNEGGPFGACIVKDGRIIAVAHNTVMKDRVRVFMGEFSLVRNCEIDKYDSNFDCEPLEDKSNFSRVLKCTYYFCY